MSLRPSRWLPSKPSNVFMCVAVVAAFCVATSARADALVELPIGHLKITPGEQRKINVEARCTPTRPLLEALAKLAGAEIAFDNPCLTYVTVWRPNRYEAPDYWIKYVAFGGAYCRATLKDNTWHVYPRGGDDYDASLSETAIVQAYRHDPISQSATTAAAIPTGIYVCQGRFVRPPYSFQTVKMPDTTIQLRLNGALIRKYETDGANILPVPKAAGIDIPPDGQFEDFPTLQKYIRVRSYREELDKSGSVEDALKATIDFLRTQNIVSSIDMKDRDLRGTEVLFKDDSQQIHWTLFPINFNYEHPGGPGVDNIKFTAAQRAQEAVAAMEKTFADDTLVLDSTLTPGGAVVLMSGVEDLERFLDLVKLTANRSVLESECILSERCSAKTMAREIAANLDSSSIPLQAGLSKLIERKRAAKQQIPIQPPQPVPGESSDHAAQAEGKH